MCVLYYRIKLNKFHSMGYVEQRAHSTHIDEYERNYFITFNPNRTKIYKLLRILVMNLIFAGCLSQYIEIIKMNFTQTVNRQTHIYAY